MRNIIISFVIIILISITFFLPAQNLIWAKSIGGTGDDLVNSIGVDANSNIYVCGSFTNTVDFDPGPGTTNVSAGARDIYISKYDNQGNFIWVKRISSASSYAIGCSFIDVDDNGDFIITGWFQSTVDFDPGPGAKLLTAKMNTAGDGDIFICKFDQNGNLKWAKSFYGSNGSGACVKTDLSKNVYTTGYFGSRGNFDPGSGTYTLAPLGLARDVFISKLDSMGNFVWAKGFGCNAEYDYGRSLAVGNNNDLYCTGVFVGDNGDFDPGPDTFLLSSSTHHYDIFILRLTHDGDFVWAKSIGGVKNEYVSTILNDNYGGIFIAGNFKGNVDFDPGPGVTNLNGDGGVDAFLAKYDTSGDLKWAKQIGGPDSVEYVNSIQMDKNRDIYTCGTFGSSADFDPGPGTTNIFSQGASDIFTAKFLHNGDLAWAKTAGGASYDYGISICVDPNGSVYSTGEYNISVNYDPPSSSSFYSSGMYDVLWLKYSNAVGLNENENNADGILVYPNPASDVIKICNNGSNKRMELGLYSLTGERIRTVIVEKEAELDVSKLTSGVYFLKAKIGNKWVYKKISVLR